MEGAPVNSLAWSRIISDFSDAEAVAKILFLASDRCSSGKNSGLFSVDECFHPRIETSLVFRNVSEETFKRNCDDYCSEVQSVEAGIPISG